LNHEGTAAAGDDWALDLEVTSNRPDCLGHLGIAREIAVLFDLPLAIPSATYSESRTNVSELTRVRIECPQLCYRYSARVIRNVRVGPSPAWLQNRLRTLGIAVINNVVDITNYVMMECGQPLHAFDFARLRGREIVVRAARAGEPFTAIDHKTYVLDADMCVIADAQVPVALGGVMGGAETEVSAGTTELLIEAAEFAPTSIRATARKLNLHSPSSYRFERGVDPDGLDWASRRCCELIVQFGGGEAAAGSVCAGRETDRPSAIVLRFSQLPRILGIDVPPDAVQRILSALGARERQRSADWIEVLPPSWRRDLTREIDLIEEVARIHGYDQIPEDAAVPMCPSHRRDDDRVLARVRGVLNAAGFDEAMTASVVPAAWCSAFSPWSAAQPLVTQTPMLKGADQLRVSLIPSLLEARRVNEAIGNPVIELFETAHVYLACEGGLPNEQFSLGVTSGGDFFEVKGVVEGVLESLHIAARLETAEIQSTLLQSPAASELRLDGQRLGVLGQVSAAGLKQFGLRGPTTIAELSLEVLAKFACLAPRYVEQSPYPAISRDLNLIVDEPTRWSDLADTVRSAAGTMLETLTYRETYRDPQRDGAGKKRLLFSFSVRSPQRTLTSEEVDQLRDRIVAACADRHGAKLFGIEIS
jgi:phenylalanyl-tRNA synthetase beta chain